MAKQQKKNTRNENKPAPKKPVLRFMVGDSVEFQRDDCTGWHSGTVEEIWYRESKWPDQRQSCPYRVEQRSEIPQELHKKKYPTKVCIEIDDDQHIRVLHHPQFPITSVPVGLVPPPEPEDPLSFLYYSTVQQDDPLKLAIMEAVNEFKETHQATRIEVHKQHDGGGTTLRLLGAQETSIAKASSDELPTFYMPNDEVWQTEQQHHECQGRLSYRKLDTIFLFGYIAPRIYFRRPIQDSHRPNSFENVKSIVPFPETSLEELMQSVTCQSISERNKKLLNIADALQFQILGDDRNYARAQVCYRAAAFGITEKEAARSEHATQLAHGLPEAMCALAVTFHCSAEMIVHAKLHNLDTLVGGAWGQDRPGLNVEEIIRYLIRYPNASFNNIPIRQNITGVMGALSSALRFGWLCSLAYEYGKFFDQEETKEAARLLWNDEQDQKNIQHLHDAYLSHQITLQIRGEKQQMLRSMNRYGTPSAGTISSFGPKSVEILKSIPTTCYRLSGSAPLPCLSNVILDIRFFEVTSAPTKPVCVLLACPDTNFWDILRLPQNLQLFPFSDQAFEFIWSRIAFLIHLGLQVQETITDPYARRIRPTKCRLRDVAGDRRFADFLQIKCLTIHGTKVELREFDEDDGDSSILGLHPEESYLYDTKLLLKMKQEIEEDEQVLEPQFPFWYKIHHRSGTPLQLIRAGNPQQIIASDSTDVNDIMKEVSSLKDLGNRHFEMCMHAKAQKEYLKGIARIRCIHNPAREALELLGALLSNHALCCLELAKVQTPTRGSFTLKEAILGCDLVLSGHGELGLLAALSSALVEKLQFRRELAASRRPQWIDVYHEGMRSGFRGRATVVACEVKHNLRLFSSDADHVKATNKVQVLRGKSMMFHSGDSQCPICHDDFHDELADQFCCKFPCGHVHCAKCLLQHQCLGDGSRMPCPICRQTIEEEQWEGAIQDITSLCAPQLLEKVALLPLDTLADRLEVIRSLLLKRGCDPQLVGNALDEMLYLNATGNTQLAKDLSSVEKQRIYVKARRPVLVLEEKYDAVQSKLRALKRSDKAYADLEQQLQDILQQLLQASSDAASDIFSKLNSVGSMARLNEGNEYQLDFHSLKVQEAKEKFEELVEPVLAVVKKVVLVTGHARHREKPGSIKHALLKYIKSRHSNMACELVPKNPGAIRVKYNPEGGNVD